MPSTFLPGQEGPFFLDVSSSCPTDCHNITEILLKVVLNIITLTPSSVEFLIVLAYWNISPQVDKSLHSDTLS
jgi:hypothetical protein